MAAVFRVCPSPTAPAVVTDTDAARARRGADAAIEAASRLRFMSRRGSGRGPPPLLPTFFIYLLPAQLAVGYKRARELRNSILWCSFMRHILSFTVYQR